ncbi:MAG: hypothetical protein EPO09_10450, partial [Aquabacterium sp.]
MLSSSSHFSRYWRMGILWCALAPLGACGGSSPPNEGAVQSGSGTAGSRLQAALVNADTVLTRQQATRFLTQATFGPTPDDVAHLMTQGYAAWIDEQMALPVPASSHVA